MKRLFTIAVMLFVSVAMVAQVEHLKFTQNGEFASLSESPTPLSSYTLSVSRNTQNSGTTASINYQSSTLSSDFSTFTIVEIFGNFTPTDFTGVNTNNMTLNFSTADLDPANSFALTCVLNLNTFTETCSPAAAGTISVSWRQNGAQSNELVLGQEQTIGNLTVRTHQRSDNSTANASGTVFGMTVVGGNATVGINHTSTLEAIRTQ
jgi:hypothetical protein